MCDMMPLSLNGHHHKQKRINESIACLLALPPVDSGVGSYSLLCYIYKKKYDPLSSSASTPTPYYCRITPHVL